MNPYQSINQANNQSSLYHFFSLLIFPKINQMQIISWPPWILGFGTIRCMNTLRVIPYQSINQANNQSSLYYSFSLLVFPKSIKYKSLVWRYEYLDLIQHWLLTLNVWILINQLIKQTINQACITFSPYSSFPKSIKYISLALWIFGLGTTWIINT